MSTEKLLEERQTTHGEYADHAACTQDLMRVMQAYKNWYDLPDIMKESLHMFAHKIGRVLTGNAYVEDHWRDIAGYSVLVAQRVEDKVGLKEEYVREPRAAGPGAVVIAVARNDEVPDPFGPEREATIPPGTPEDGAHHARQQYSYDDDEVTVTPSPVSVSDLDTDRDTVFKTRSGDYIKVDAFHPNGVYPVSARYVRPYFDGAGANIVGYVTDDRPHSFVKLTGAGRASLEKDTGMDLVERIHIHV